MNNAGTIGMSRTHWTEQPQILERLFANSPLLDVQMAAMEGEMAAVQEEDEVQQGLMKGRLGGGLAHWKCSNIC